MMLVDPAPLYHIPKGVQTRWASAENWQGEKGAGGQKNGGRKGSASFALGPGESKVLAKVTGASGTVRRIWMTFGDRSARMLRGMRLDFQWDGCARPAASVPLGDFFMHGLGRMATFETALFSSPEGRSCNCFVPMPFKTGMEIVLTNETTQPQGSVYYDVAYTLGDNHEDDTPYFHACFNRQNPTAMQQDYEILPRVEGGGRFLGCNIGVIADAEQYLTTWWGEGEFKAYVDGDTDLPTLCGTGTEDYIGTAWGQGHFVNLYQGCHIVDWEKMRFGFYRLHVPDPTYFSKDFRATIQQIGCASRVENRQRLRGLGRELIKNSPGREPVESTDEQSFNFEREDDWSSCAYFYLDRPESNLPDLMPLEKRTEGLVGEGPAG